MEQNSLLARKYDATLTIRGRVRAIIILIGVCFIIKGIITINSQIFKNYNGEKEDNWASRLPILKDNVSNDQLRKLHWGIACAGRISNDFALTLVVGS